MQRVFEWQLERQSLALNLTFTFNIFLLGLIILVCLPDKYKDEVDARRGFEVLPVATVVPSPPPPPPDLNR